MPRASRGALYGRRILSRPATPYYKLFFDRCQAFSSIYLRTTKNARSAFFFVKRQAVMPRASRGALHKRCGLLYPAPPPHIINYPLTFVKHFLALIYGQRTMRASEASEQGIRRKLIPPRHPVLYHGF